MSTTDGTVTINSVDLHLDGAWRLIDPTPLLAHGPARGADRVIPGSAGVEYRAKVLGALRVPLRLRVLGEKDQLGASHSNEWDGLRDNLAYLHAQLHAANVGTVSVVYTFPDLSTKSATCYVDSISEVATTSIAVPRAVVVLGVVVPAGKLT